VTEAPRPFTEIEIELLQTFADQAVIAIENVRLFTELGTKNAALTESLEQQTATAEILRVISSSPTDIQPVLDAVAESSARLCEASDGVIQLRDPDNHLRIAAHFGSIPAAIGTRRPIAADWVAGRCVLDARALHVHDLQAEEAEYPRGSQIARAAGHRSLLAMPLLREGEAVGVIQIRRTEVRPFAEKHLTLLRTFADQAVIAIENVRLFNELATKNAALTESLEQQTATSEILRVISSSPTDTQPVFDTIIRNAVRLSGAAWGSVFRVEAGFIDMVAHENLSGDQLERVRRLWPQPVDGVGPTPRVAMSGQVLRVADVHAGDHGLRPETLAEFRARDVRSLVVVPMSRHGRVIGTINLTRHAVGAFSDAHVALIRTFADQAVIAIENVRLFKELESRNAALSESLEQQTATAGILRVISGSPTDVQPVLDAVAESAARVCGADDAIVLRRDDGIVRRVAHFGDLPLARPPVRPLDDRNVVGRALAERRTIHVHDLVTAADEYPDQSGEGIRTILVAPLMRDDAAIGALIMRRTMVRPFTDKQIALLETFAAQAVIAIENVRLFKELESRNAEVTEALEQQTATAEILRVINAAQVDLQPVFEAIAASAARLCDGLTGGVFLVEGDRVRPAAHYNFESEAFDGVLPAPLDSDLLTVRAIAERRVVHTADILAEPDYRHPELVERLGFRSALSVPMMREGAPIGAIIVTRAQPGRFSDKQIALLQTFADQAVIAIENVRLLTELQHRNAEVTEALEQQTATSEILRSIGGATMDAQPVFETIVRNAVTLCEGRYGAVYRWDGSRVHVVAYANIHERLADWLDQFPRDLRPRDQPDLLRLVIESGDLVRIDDAETDARVPPAGVARRAGVRSMLFVPMRREETVLGVIAVNHSKPAAFTEARVELLKTLADQAVIAIENVRLFTELQERTQQVQVANRHKDEFLANMSHELRTPLNAIIGFSEVMLERMFGDLTDKQEEYLNDILSSGRHLLSLINDILDLSKIEAGRMELELTDFNLPVAIDNALTLVHERAARRGLTLTQNVDEALGDFSGDERQIKQVLLNLLSNAIKFTPEGGKVEVRAHLKGDVVEIAVADTGIGIAPEDQELVFEEFRQVGSDLAKKHEGTGLGLALARRFVELHGGNLWLESEAGVGSTFTFDLPVRR